MVRVMWGAFLQQRLLERSRPTLLSALFLVVLLALNCSRDVYIFRWQLESPPKIVIRVTPLARVYETSSRDGQPRWV
jgi:hypothetical protein